MAMNSFRSFAATLAPFTAMTIGPEVTIAIGAKSRVKSKLRFGYTTWLMMWVLVASSSV